MADCCRRARCSLRGVTLRLRTELTGDDRFNLGTADSGGVQGTEFAVQGVTLKIYTPLQVSQAYSLFSGSSVASSFQVAPVMVTIGIFRIPELSLQMP